MKVLALDPSSTCTGYGLLSFDSERVLAAGRMVPPKKTAPPLDRIRSMVVEVSAVLREHEPHAVVIEMPIGRQYSRGGARTSSLAVWATAAGAIWGFCLLHQQYRGLYEVSNSWMGAGGKDRNRVTMRSLVPSYDALADPGGDMADAVCLGLHWIRNQKIGHARRSKQ